MLKNLFKSLKIIILKVFSTNLKSMILQALFDVKKLIYSNLYDFINLNKPQKSFILEIMILFLSIKGRLNFLQFARFGKYGEQRYRQQFEKPFDFLSFNKNIVVSHASENLAIAFDPSYIPKSGKKTPGLGKYWSGVAGESKKGLEIGGIAAIDLDNNTALHLEAVQTPSNSILKAANQTLTDWYANLIAQRKDHLHTISNYIIADAYFSKKKFVDVISTAEFFLVSRFRKDADLMYLVNYVPTGKRGRPKKLGAKINFKNIDKTYFQLIDENADSQTYTAEVYSKALKCNIRLVIVLEQHEKTTKHILYFSTDVNQDAQSILKMYKCRFQIEFLYRDGKQHTGLQDCQARCEKKLYFHFNTSLTSLNIAKVQHWYSIPKNERGAFSMADVKTIYHNTLMLNRFIEVFAVSPNKLKNSKHVNELINFGRIAA